MTTNLDCHAKDILSCNAGSTIASAQKQSGPLPYYKEKPDSLSKYAKAKPALVFPVPGGLYFT